MSNSNNKYQKGTILPNGYILGQGRGAFDLTETQIRYAMKNSSSNGEAARFLNVCFNTYKKYAKQYVDSDSGKTLFELHKAQKRGKQSRPTKAKKLISIDDILLGKHPEYAHSKLASRLSNVGHLHNFPHNCHNCGYSEPRINDNSIPLILDHINDNWFDHNRDNLRWLCYNCFHNLKGNLYGKKPQWRIDQLRTAVALAKSEYPDLYKEAHERNIRVRTTEMEKRLAQDKKLLKKIENKKQKGNSYE